MTVKQLKKPPALLRHQQGFSLIIALFILVVLGFLGAVMLRMQSSANEQVNSSVLSTRAFLSAESGVQECLSDIFLGGGSNCSSCPTEAADCSTSVTENFGGSPEWLSCSAEVVCCRIDPGDGNNHFRILSTGRCGPVGRESIRRLEVFAKDSSY